LWKARTFDLQISAEFVTSAAGAGDFPRDRLPEVALVGRSNVGKSSLLNALMRRTLARTSAAPGKTRLANFYRVQRGASPALFLVDLPGYGYARGGDASAHEFNALANAYFSRAGGPQGGALRNRHGEGLPPSREATAEHPGGPRSRPPGSAAPVGSHRNRTGAGGHGPPVAIGVVLLVDSRHPGLESDMQAWDWLQSQPFPHGVVGTKVDKLSRAERARHARQFQTLFDMPVPMVSAHSGEGLDELWKMIASLPRPTAA
jgi:GTP-binding protein